MKRFLGAAFAAALFFVGVASAHAEQTTTVAVADHLRIDVMSATLTVRHEQRKDVAITTNHPEHWKLRSGVIEQTDASTRVGNGVISSTSISITFFGYHFGSASNTNTADQDTIVIAVPAQYHGDLNLQFSGVQSGSLDGWHAGNITIANSSTGSLTTGDLESSGKVELRNGGVGTMQVGAVTAATFSADNSSTGGLRLGTIKATSASVSNTGIGSVNAGAVDAGSVTVHNTSTDNVRISSVDAGHLSVDNGGTGGVTISGGHADGGSATNSGIEDVSLHGAFNVDTNSTGIGKVRVRR